DGQLQSPTSAGTNSYTTVNVTEAPPATTTSTIAASSTTSTSSTTTTLPPEGDPCASEPAFPSLACRIAALLPETEAQSTPTRAAPLRGRAGLPPARPPPRRPHDGDRGREHSRPRARAAAVTARQGEGAHGVGRHAVRRRSAAAAGAAAEARRTPADEVRPPV